MAGDPRFPRPFASLVAYFDVRMTTAMLGTGAFPDGGCLNDQDPQAVKDWRVIHPVVERHLQDEANR